MTGRACDPTEDQEIDLLERLRWAGHATAVVFLWFLDAMCVLARLQLELANWFPDAFEDACGRRRFAIILPLLVKLALLASHLLLFSEWALTRTGDLPGWRQSRLGEALLGRKIVVFDKTSVAVVVQLVEKPVPDKTDLTLSDLTGDWLELRWLFHDIARGSNIAVWVSKGKVKSTQKPYLLSCLA